MWKDNDKLTVQHMYQALNIQVCRDEDKQVKAGMDPATACKKTMEFLQELKGATYDELFEWYEACFGPQDKSLRTK